MKKALFAVVLLVLLVLAGCTEEPRAGAPGPPEDVLEVVGGALDPGPTPGLIWVSGTLVNASEETVERAILQFLLLDETGQPCGSAKEMFEWLAPWEERPFRVLVQATRLPVDARWRAELLVLAGAR